MKPLMLLYEMLKVGNLGLRFHPLSSPELSDHRSALLLVSADNPQPTGQSRIQSGLAIFSTTISIS